MDSKCNQKNVEVAMVVGVVRSFSGFYLLPKHQKR